MSVANKGLNVLKKKKNLLEQQLLDGFYVAYAVLYVLLYHLYLHIDRRKVKRLI